MKTTLSNYYLVILIFLTITVYAIMSYGGIRSPDSEVTFRTTQSLATTGIFGLSKEPGQMVFGLTPGQDGKLYSIFGPAEAIAAVPLFWFAKVVVDSKWFQDVQGSVPISHYVENGLKDFVTGGTPQHLEPHALRFIVSMFNVVVSSLCAIIFFFLVNALTQSKESAMCTTILFAFGTLVFPYSGTFFSEPLATFFVMLSLYVLVYNDMKNDSIKYSYIYLVLSGISLGLATATHITAILFIPFYCFYAVCTFHDRMELTVKNAAILSGMFMLGAGLIVILLGYYNYIRFGNLLETGRFIFYSSFVAPWKGFIGLLFSSGKGLLLYCPAIALSFVFWKPFHRRHRYLSIMIIGAVLLRVIFISSRSDWHGGFSLGPRYLVMIIPLLVLPLGELVNGILQKGKIKYLVAFAFFTFFCITQQIYFSLGEIFSFLHNVKWKGARLGIDVFHDYFLYFNWESSPLIFLLSGQKGSFLLSFILVGNYTLWLSLMLLTGLFLYPFYNRLIIRFPRSETAV